MSETKSTYIHQKGAICLQDVINLARSNPEYNKCGAIVTFTGVVRGYTHDGKQVLKLKVEACEVEASRALNKISKELSSSPEIIEVLIHHLVGDFFVGEDLVYVVVMGKSRNDAFQTLKQAVEMYKKKAEIWKKEYLIDGTSYWIS